MLNLKRKEFQALTPSLELITGRNQARPITPSVKGGNNRILTVKDALPNLPTVPKIIKERTAERSADCETSTQPIIKQALPSLNSSSLQGLVKEPLPSVQPPGAVQATAKSDSQTLTTETVENTGAGQQCIEKKKQYLIKYIS